LQIFELQSRGDWHCSPGWQRGQLPPPQSTSVSDPFWSPSEHVAAWHVPF
jgi:hypothetical protein